MAQTFSSAVKDWAEKTEVKQTAIMHLALRDLDVEVAENTPVVSGNTKNSRTVSTLGPVRIEWKTKKFRDPSDAINNAVAGVVVGEKVWFGFRAPWAHTLEPKYAIMRLAVQRWQQIVDRAVSVLR